MIQVGIQIDGYDNDQANQIIGEFCQQYPDAKFIDLSESRTPDIPIVSAFLISFAASAAIPLAQWLYNRFLNSPNAKVTITIQGEKMEFTYKGERKGEQLNEDVISTISSFILKNETNESK